MQKNKVAVLLYGFVRTYQLTAPSFIKNVLKPNKADLFIHCYDNEGVSCCATENLNAYKIKNALSEDFLGSKVTPESLKKAYKSYLKSYKIIPYRRDYFQRQTQGIFQTSLPLERFISLYFNISEVFKLLETYIKEKNVKYDAVILARPDLQFYSQIRVDEMNLNALNIPMYGGNINFNGISELYYVTSYKNVARGEYIPWHDVPFSDQLIISSYKNMRPLKTLFSLLKTYNEYGLPIALPETSVYYHIGYLHHLKVCTVRVLYEILRNNYLPKDNGLMHAYQMTDISKISYRQIVFKFWFYKILKKMTFSRHKTIQKKYQKIKDIFNKIKKEKQ